MKPDVFDLTGKTAIITGGASGLGKRMAETLAAAGASVAIADINEPGAQQIANEITAKGGNALPVEMDVSDPESVMGSVAQVLSAYGTLDIGINAAGVAAGREEDKTPVDIWNHVINIDLNGVYYCCLEYASVMKKQRHGKIINIASMSATVVNNFPQPPVEDSRLLGIPAYCAAKAGVKQLTKVLAAQLSQHGIRVNCISPGYMNTEMTTEIFRMPEVIEQIEKETPLGKIGQPKDLDGLILYLSSGASDFMTGSELMIDGGYSIW